MKEQYLFADVPATGGDLTHGLRRARRLNGTDTSTGTDPRKRVMMAAADQIATFIATHRAGGAK